jgi:hypothetical protein
MAQYDKQGARNAAKAARLQQLRNRVTYLRDKRTEVASRMQGDPDLPIRETQAHRDAIDAQIQRLMQALTEVTPYIRRIRTLVNDPLDNTRITACYFLFAKLYNTLNAILLLARQGFYYEVMELSRSHREALELVALFIREPSDSALIQKWFAGDTIMNATAREKFGAILDLSRPASDTAALPMEEVSFRIYSGLSIHSHHSYIALLDCYDLYRDDLDFESFAGHRHMSLRGMPFVRLQVHMTLIALRSFYYYAVPDLACLTGVQMIERRYEPWV